MLFVGSGWNSRFFRFLCGGEGAQPCWPPDILHSWRSSAPQGFPLLVKHEEISSPLTRSITSELFGRETHCFTKLKIVNHISKWFELLLIKFETRNELSVFSGSKWASIFQDFWAQEPRLFSKISNFWCSGVSCCYFAWPTGCFLLASKSYFLRFGVQISWFHQENGFLESPLSYRSFGGSVDSR